MLGVGSVFAVVLVVALSVLGAAETRVLGVGSVLAVVLVVAL